MSDTIRQLHGEPTRFHVQSRTDSDWLYMVDIAARFPLGQCSCAQYTCKLWPAYQATKQVKRCWHLRAARDFALNLTIAQHIRDERRHAPPSSRFPSHD